MGDAINKNTIKIKERKLWQKEKKTLIPGLSFSYKKAFGITKAKRKIAKATGIPTTRSGRRSKIGKILGIK